MSGLAALVLLIVFAVMWMLSALKQGATSFLVLFATASPEGRVRLVVFAVVAAVFFAHLWHQASDQADRSRLCFRSCDIELDLTKDTYRWQSCREDCARH